MFEVYWLFVQGGVTWDSDEVLKGCVVDGKPEIDDIFLEAEKSGFDVRSPPSGDAQKVTQTIGVTFGFFGSDDSLLGAADSFPATAPTIVTVSDAATAHSSAKSQNQKQQQLEMQRADPVKFKTVIATAQLFRSNR